MVTACHQVRHIGGRIFDPLAVDHRIRQALRQDDILNDIQQRRTVRASPQSDRRTDKVDTRHRLRLYMVRRIDHHIGNQGIIDFLRFRTVPGMIVQKDTSLLINRSGIAVHNAIIRFFVGVERHVTDAISSECEDLPLMQMFGQRVLLCIRGVDNIQERSGISFNIGCSSQRIVIQRQDPDTVIHGIAGIAGHTYYFT